MLLVSAFADPEVLNRLVRPDGKWFYLGKRLENYRRFKSYLENLGCQALASPRDFHNHVAQTRQPFMDWLEQVHQWRGKLIDHWASEVYGGDPDISNLLLNFSYLTFLSPWLGEKGLILVFERPAIARVLAGLARKEGRPARVIEIGRSQRHLNLEILRKLAGLGYRGLTFGLRALMAWTKRRTYQAKLRQHKIEVMIGTFVHDYSINSDFQFKDRYFPYLHEWLMAQGKKVAVIPDFHEFGFKRSLSIIKKIRNCQTDFILLEDFLTYSDYRFAADFWTRHRQRRGQEMVPPFNGFEVEALVWEEEKINYFSWDNFYALLRYRLPARLKAVGIIPEHFIIWDEGQGSQRCAMRGIREQLPGIPITGAQILVQYHNRLMYYPTEQKKRHQVLPHRYLVAGAHGKRVLKTYFQDISVEPGSSLRYGYVSRAVASRPKSLPAGETILVLLPFTIKEVLDLMAIAYAPLLKAAQNGRPVLLRNHPDYSPLEAEQALRKTGCYHPRLTWVSGPLEKLFETAQVVVSAGSGAAVEALCFGVRVIIIGSTLGLDNNPLEKLDPLRWREVFDPQEFEQILNDWAVSGTAPQGERSDAEFFFLPNTPEYLVRYLKPFCHPLGN